MIIGDQFREDKLYHSLIHYDNMPLTNGDLQEYRDTEHTKRELILNSLFDGIGGMLYTPQFYDLGEDGVHGGQTALLIDGDVIIIDDDSSNPLISKEEIVSAGYAEGVICILGWYQRLNATSTLRKYGGVNNSIIPNDLMNEHFNAQISSRIQFRWLPIVINKSLLESTSITLTFTDRDKHGNKLSTQSTITSTVKTDTIAVFDKPTIMDYAESDLFLIPIGEYTFANNKITSLAPTERLSAVSKVSMLQYQSTYVIENTEGPKDIIVPINISELTDSDILSVSYESVLLYADEHYTINYDTNTIKLLNFHTIEGDKVYFTVTKLVDTKNVTTIAAMLSEHTQLVASSTVNGHTMLTDTLSESSKDDGLAATPKLVKSAVDNIEDRLDDVDEAIEDLEEAISGISTAMTIVDDTTAITYKFGMSNGILYLEEV